MKKEITKGTSENTFSPGKSCTRAEMVTFLWRANGSPDPKSTKSPFSDVPEGKWYYKAVLWAVENEITQGVSKDAFNPSGTLTRAQTVTFLYRAAGSPEVSGKSFSDVPSGKYYTNAVLWAVKQGVTEGTSKDTFSPNAPCTRGQIVTFLYRAMK